MTETELKLRDAATQMKIALRNPSDDEIFRSCVNSYISLARSVTFVMQSESAAIPELKAWYDVEMGKLKESPLLRFFNEKRVYSIHKGVVTPIVHTVPIMNLRVNGSVYSGEGTMTIVRFEGAEKFFPGGSHNVFQLCEQYFIVLKELVGAWLRKRMELNIR